LSSLGTGREFCVAEEGGEGEREKRKRKRKRGASEEAASRKETAVGLLN
jgi:hypothetical protein